MELIALYQNDVSIFKLAFHRDSAQILPSFEMVFIQAILCSCTSLSKRVFVCARARANICACVYVCMCVLHVCMWLVGNGAKEVSPPLTFVLNALFHLVISNKGAKVIVFLS